MENYSDCKTNFVLCKKTKTILGIPATFKILQKCWLAPFCFICIMYIHHLYVCTRLRLWYRALQYQKYLAQFRMLSSTFITFYCNYKVVNLIIDQNSSKRKTVVYLSKTKNNGMGILICGPNCMFTLIK